MPGIERGRRWEGLWARLDLAAVDLRSNRYAEADGAHPRGPRRGDEHRQRSAADARRADRARGEGPRRRKSEPWHPLTVREFEVAQLIAAGMTNAELADELSISPKTASAHVEHILAKLGVARRTEIAAWTSSIATTPSPTAVGVARRR